MAGLHAEDARDPATEVVCGAQPPRGGAQSGHKPGDRQHDGGSGRRSGLDWEAVVALSDEEFPGIFTIPRASSGR